MSAVPSVIEDGAGERLRVRRAWPKSGGPLTFEAMDRQHRIRAGAIGADGAVTVAPFAEDPDLPGLREWAGTVEPSDALLVHRYRPRGAAGNGRQSGTPVREAARAGQSRGGRERFVVDASCRLQRALPRSCGAVGVYAFRPQWHALANQRLGR